MATDYPNPIDIQDVNDEIWFDIINRTITLKEGYSSEDILVQNDANSRNLGFIIQRYFENEDLSTKKIKIHYINSLGQHDCDDIHSQEIVGDNDDVLSFMWLVSKEVCVEAGNIEFAIEFYNDDGYDWFTKPTQLSVSQGIYTIGEIDTSADWYKIFRDSKLDKNQGVENSGKVMMVNRNGVLVPKSISNISNSGGGITDELKIALATYFTNIQTLLPQLVYITEENIGNTLMQDAKDIVAVLEEMPTVEPEAPTDKTLVSISATYTGGNVTVGKDVSSLTGVTVTATYSDGSTSEVTGYTLSGEIAEGENTITVTYNGLTTTFIVVGEEVVFDENAVNIYTGFVGQDSTSTSEPTTNDQYPNAVCSDAITIPYVETDTGNYTFDITLNSNITNTNKINWKTYDATGIRKQSLTGDTISNIQNKYSVRLNLLDQTATADGNNAEITGFTISVKNVVGTVVKTVTRGINDLRG